MVNALDWAYRDPLCLDLMGETAENLAGDFDYLRSAMDDYALTSGALARRSRAGSCHGKSHRSRSQMESWSGSFGRRISATIDRG
jgi:hypothetical protein